jgi:hypothetical protein
MYTTATTSAGILSRVVRARSSDPEAPNCACAGSTPEACGAELGHPCRTAGGAASRAATNGPACKRHSRSKSHHMAFPDALAHYHCSAAACRQSMCSFRCHGVHHPSDHMVRPRAAARGVMTGTTSSAKAHAYECTDATHAPMPLKNTRSQHEQQRPNAHAAPSGRPSCSRLTCR